MNLDRMLNILSGAVLGAAFYTLLKTRPYLVSRSFDPKYTTDYMSRLVIGTIGGIILATILKVETADAGNKWVQFTPGVLGILGGYSAEVVEQVLQRLVEVLMALLRGDGSAEGKAKAIASQAEKNADIRGKLVELEAARGDAVKFKKIADEMAAALKKHD